MGYYKNGLLDGEYTEWYKNNVLFKQKNYKDGGLNGPSKRWDKNGNEK